MGVNFAAKKGCLTKEQKYMRAISCLQPLSVNVISRLLTSISWAPRDKLLTFFTFLEEPI